MKVFLFLILLSLEAHGCIFCKIINREKEDKIVMETDDVIVLEDANPVTPIHYLVIPKRHVKNINEADPDMIVKLWEMVNVLAKKIPNYNLMVNTGAQSGQKVFHLHIHFFAGKQALAICGS